MAAETGISIRPYRVDDAAALCEAASESGLEVHPFMPWCRSGLTVDELRRWIATQVLAFEAGKAYEFIILSEGGRFLGGCGLNQIDDLNHRANLGYWVRSSISGRGVATAAIQQLVQWAFTNTDLVRLEVVVSTRNTASLRTAEKAGAVREGVLRRRLLLHGTWHDAVIFSFIRTDSRAG